MTTLTTAVMTVAGISWKPEIRGALTVAIAVTILCGSIYLILGTNLGSRLGFLVALTGLMGWMVILGSVWWMYGKGPLGEAPTWQVIEVNEGDLSQASLEAISEDPELSGWKELDAANPDRAEAQATVDEELTLSERARFDATNQYVAIDGYALGGKPERSGDSLVDRAIYTVTDALNITNPTHYALIQVRPAIETAPIPGQPPPVPTADPTQPVISVIMIRDLGDLRFPPAMVTLGSLLIFGVLCNVLHRRDKLAHEHQEQAAALAKAAT